MHRELVRATQDDANPVATFGILSLGTLEAAVDRHQWGPFPFGDDLAARAAFLLRSIVQDHPFADGNKRTGVAAVETFVQPNGARLDLRDDEWEAFLIRIARSQADLREITAWLRRHVGNLMGEPDR